MQWYSALTTGRGEVSVKFTRNCFAGLDSGQAEGHGWESSQAMTLPTSLGAGVEAGGKVEAGGSQWEGGIRSTRQPRERLWKGQKGGEDWEEKGPWLRKSQAWTVRTIHPSEERGKLLGIGALAARVLDTARFDCFAGEMHDILHQYDTWH